MTRVLTQILKQNQKVIKAEMLINDQPVIFQIDCGASVNVIPERYIKHTSTLTSCNTTLHMSNKTVVRPRGKTRLTIRNPKTRKKYSVEFFVVAENLIPLLGKETSEAMDLITINYNKFESVAKIVPSETGDIFITFADVFDDKQGNFSGIAHFEIDPTVNL